MAISRMQQPRQMYGLGSFVKKAVGKVTKPFTKVAKKLVPKEIAGIMRVAAPFLPPGYREAAYLLGTAKQTGRISPIDLALAAAPTFFEKTTTGQNLAAGFKGSRTGEFLLGKAPPSLDAAMAGETGTKGILGSGGEFFQFGKDKGSILDNVRALRDQTKAGQFLLGGEDGKFSKSKIAGIGVGTLSLIQNANTPREAGIALAQSTGNSDDLARGEELFSLIRPGIFDVPEAYRLPVAAANGGLMRTNYANGTKKFNDKYLSPEYADDFKKFLQELREQNKEMEMDTIMEMFKQKMRKQDPILEAKDGGLMRTNYAIGSDDEPLRPDPTKPIQPFQPKPVGPVLPDMKMAGMDRKDRAMELADMLAQEEFGQDFYDLDIRTQMRIYQIALDMIDEGGNAMGGLPNNRMDLALGTKPTPEESGLGGLPIEADMRYTGGFMPYGEKEKADDVPARLSKNEFVFTADAVRAAGGGSVNEGAKKMYTAMKQLEKKPEAKGMMA